VESFGKRELRAYMQSHKLAVAATSGADGGPQSALVGVAVTPSLEVVFDTLSTSRKHANLRRDPRIAVTFSGPDEQTLQYEGLAFPVSVTGAEDEFYREVYYEAWPEGRRHLDWPHLAYWRVTPRWARYSDYAQGPLIFECRWDAPEFKAHDTAIHCTLRLEHLSP
jgi:general stress protein 26